MEPSVGRLDPLSPRNLGWSEINPQVIPSVVMTCQTESSLGRPRVGDPDWTPGAGPELAARVETWTSGVVEHAWIPHLHDYPS